MSVLCEINIMYFVVMYMYKNYIFDFKFIW